MSIKSIFKQLGPGLMWAGAAIGVSHLVQSTRAGAMFGFELVVIVLVVNLLKYPFFEFGPRYAAATGETLLVGYKKIGKWSLWVYLLLTLLTMFTIQAAVTAVTAGIFASVIGIFSIKIWIYLLLAFGVIIVSIGKYTVIDTIVKYIVVLLTISAIVAVIPAFLNGYHPKPEFTRSFEWKFEDIAILIAFAGWMPSAIDISVWHSAWTVAKHKETGTPLSLKNSLFDFNVGYIGTAFLSIVFLSMGALVMYGSGEQMPAGGAAFADKLISMFTGSLGAWFYPIIAIAAITTMSSTTLTVIDGFPRVLSQTSQMLLPQTSKASSKKIFWIWLVILVLGTAVIVEWYMKNMESLVDFATTLSFLTAPVLGWLNLKAVTSKTFPNEAKLKPWLLILSYIGLITLTGFSVYYIIWRFI